MEVTAELLCGSVRTHRGAALVGRLTFRGTFSREHHLHCFIMLPTLLLIWLECSESFYNKYMHSPQMGLPAGHVPLVQLHLWGAASWKFLTEGLCNFYF